MVLSLMDCIIIKVFQGTHHQGDVTYGRNKGIQYSCMSLMSISQTFFRSPGRQDKLDLEDILGKGDRVFKFLDNFRYLGMEDLPQEFFLGSFAVNVLFLEIKMGEITAAAYLLRIVENVNSVQQIGTGALFIVNN